MYSATAGKIAILKINATINQAILGIIPYRELDLYYGYYSLSQRIPSIIFTHSQGSGQPNINSQIVNEIKIPIPPLVEQNRIATVLSTLDECIKKTEALIAKLHSVKAGLMQDLLTRGIDIDGRIRDESTHEFKDTEIGRVPVEWEVYSVIDLCLTYSGGTPSRDVPKYFDGEIPWVKSGELNLGVIVTTEETISQKGLDNSSAKYVPENSILIAMYGATAGKIAILKINATINQAILGVIPGRKSELYYVFYSLSQRLEDIIFTHSQGSGQPNINSKIVNNIEIPIPHLHEQYRISSILNSVDERIMIEEKYLYKLFLQKKGLMNDLLTGKIKIPEGITKKQICEM